MSYHVSIGGMKMRGWRVFFRVIRMTYAALKAAKVHPGCVHADIFRDGQRYFAMSVWDDEAAMKAYAHGGIHAQLMAHRHDWFAHFKNHSFKLDTIPSRAEAMAMWREAQKSQ